MVMNVVQANKKAWIIGAGKGIGRAVVEQLATDGWQIAVSARSEADLATLRDRYPNQISAFPLDVTDPEAVRQVSSLVHQQLGHLDLAFLNAGTYQRDSAVGFDAGLFSNMVDTNLLGVARCLETVMPQMLERRSGRILITSSVSGYTGLPGAIAYGATKAALINMCEALYPELKAHNVHLSVVNPGFVDTPLTKKNDFLMPFLISAVQAAEHVVRGIRSTGFEIAFPWKMVLAMKTLAILPACLRMAITGKMLRK
jgi:NAD(P)-dependent dehydrogenase (short-subunit alcohol dehydrogenase family)